MATTSPEKETKGVDLPAIDFWSEYKQKSKWI